MIYLEIIPVIDIMNKKAVSGKSGDRTNYKPLNSKLTNNAENLEHLINAYKANKANKVYIADLDAIMNKGNNIKIIKNLDVYKIVDCGIKNKNQLEKLEKLNFCNKLIVGTETLEDIEVLKNNYNNIILSLDFKNGELLNLLNLTLNELLEIININIPLIILDISSVGTQKGINEKLIKEITDKLKKLNKNNKIYVGGGIKNINDLEKAKNLNVNGVLIGTSIHNGTLNLKEIIEKY